MQKAEREAGKPDAAKLVADLSGLTSPPAVGVKLFELIRSTRASAQEIGDVVALDPNLAARLLRIVNSSFYGFPSRIATIPHAITILGSRNLYNLVLGLCAARSFSKLDAGLVRMETFWRHSIFCALVARQLAKHYRHPQADCLFIAGLLHEIGTCVMYSQLPDWAQQMRPIAQSGEALLYQAEIEQFGFSHATVGALALTQWQLPEELQVAVCHHHDPGNARTGQLEAALVHLADVLANQSELGAIAVSTPSVVQADDAVWAILDATPDSLDVRQVLDDASAQFSETMSNLMPRAEH